MSHLDHDHLPQGDWRQGGPLSASEIDAMFGAAGAGLGGTVHGGVVRASDVEQLRAGGSRLAVDPRSERSGADAKGLPQSAARWAGSSTLYGDQELPPNSIQGTGFAGSRSQVSAADLAARDAAARGVYSSAGAEAPPPALAPGAYQMQDGRILLVHPDGRQMALTPAQFAQVTQQAQQQAPAAPRESLSDRMLRLLRGG